jgi:ATP-dependent DNA helicase RecG
MTNNKRKSPNVYMKMAVDVMKKSIVEKNKDKPSPHVGAVLVFPDGRVDTAYRGELREGDHAEYTVLDKKNRHSDLTGCWLFATLEPCAPGARNSPKVSCAERIVNARISEVWFGIEDKNPKVDHSGIDYLLENGVKVHQFGPEFHKEIEDANKKFNT